MKKIFYIHTVKRYLLILFSTLCIFPMMALDAPQNVSASNVVGTNSISISWDNVDAATSYKILRSISYTSTYNEIKQISASPYTDTENLLPGTTYYYQVQAINEMEEGPKSDPVSATIPYEIPTGLTLKINCSSGGIDISFTPINGADSYTISRATTSGGGYTDVITTSNSSYFDSNAKTANETYYYVVRANYGGDSSANSDEASIAYTCCFEILHVNSNSSASSGDGSSWSSPLFTLTDALNKVNEYPGCVKQIWLAEGYYNTTSAVGFRLPAGVKIYGAFPDPENPDSPTNNPGMSHRNWGLYPTVLTRSGTAYHIMVGLNIPDDGETLLDGVIIRDGYHNYSNSYIPIDGVDIKDGYGAGLYLHNASPVLKNIVIEENEAYLNGGGIYITANSNLTLVNSLVHKNTTNSYGNSQVSDIYVDGTGSSLHAINATITNNDYNYQYVLYNNRGTIFLDNSIIWNGYQNYDLNAIELSLGGYTDDTYITRRNSMVGGIYDNTHGNISSTNPGFISSGYRLDSNSPLIDKGSNSLYPVPEINYPDEKDIEGEPRFQNTTIDIGAYEGYNDCENPTSYPNDRIYVKEGGTGFGTSWGCAYGSLSDALSKAKQIYDQDGTEIQIWVAKGTYYPETFPEGVDTSDPRNRSFVLSNGIYIYGGFADDLTGVEGNTYNRPFASETILSGDIGYGVLGYGNQKDDYINIDTDGYYINTEDNTYHVMLVVNTINSHIDGIVIEGGRADGLSEMVIGGKTIENYAGGGIYVNMGEYGNLKLENVTFQNNTTDLGIGKGGGVYITGENSSYFSIGNSYLFNQNKASEGGAIYAKNMTQSINFDSYSSESSFSNNIATIRGGACAFTNIQTGGNDYALYLNDINFINNKAGSEGGAIYLSNVEKIRQDGCVFENNEADLGGAIYAPSNNIDFENSVRYTNNTAKIHGGAIYYISNNNSLYFVDNSTTQFTSNKALLGNGGAFYCYGPANISVYYSLITFNGNEALNGSGGGYYGVGNFTDSDFAEFNQLSALNNYAKHAGAGIYMETYNYYIKSGNIRNNTLIDTGKGVGAGIFNYNSQIEMGYYQNYGDNKPIPILISGNTSSHEGGGMANYAGSGGTMKWIDINRNSAAYGAGISNSYTRKDENGIFRIENVNITDNTATGDIQGNLGGGGILNANSSPLITSSLIANNRVESVGGAGIFNIANEDSVSNPVLVNVTIANNKAENESDGTLLPGGAMYNKGTAGANPENVKPVIATTIIWGNTGFAGNENIININALPSYSFSLVQGSGGSATWNSGFGENGGSNIDRDPFFINSSSNFMIKDISPAADKGDAAVYESLTGDYPSPDNLYYDLVGKSRSHYDEENNVLISMGAYERITCPPSLSPTLGILYVSEEGSGQKDGSSWAHAYPGLADPLKYAAEYPGCIVEIWVAKGTYYPQHKIAKAGVPAQFSYYENNIETNIDWNNELQSYYYESNNGYPNYEIIGTGLIDLSDNRDKAFLLVEGVKVYGGFAGTESSPEERTDIHGANQTILSGDIDYFETGDITLKDDYGVINADNTFGNTSGNAYHVVVATGQISGNTLLDGFTIQGGSAFYTVEEYDENGKYNLQYSLQVAVPAGSDSGDRVDKQLGGGLYIGRFSTPILSNLIIKDNYARYSGGGLYTYGEYQGSNPPVDVNLFSAVSDEADETSRNNQRKSLQKMGAAIGASLDEVDLFSLNNVELSNNRAAYGAGIYTEGKNMKIKTFDIHDNATFTLVDFEGYYLGGIGGGIYSSTSLLNLLNGKITNNTAIAAGGIYISGGMNGPAPSFFLRSLAIDNGSIFYYLTNVTLSGNHAVAEKRENIPTWQMVGGLVVDGMDNGNDNNISDSSPVGYINNTIIWGNTKGTARDTANVAFILVGNYETGVLEPWITFKNSLMQGSNGTGSSWDKSKFGTDGLGNIDVNPEFLDNGADYRLFSTSPAIDKGLNTLYNSQGGLTIDFDIAGNLRFWNAETNAAANAIIDMGAYEYIGPKSKCPDPTPLPEEYADGIFVNSQRNGYGESWDCAFHSLYDALIRAREVGTPINIYVAKGIYYPEQYILDDGIIYEDERNKAFVINNVTIYGGYPDDLTGITTDDALRVHKEETFLSGDLDRTANPDGMQNDGVLTGREGNAYHVVVLGNSSNSTLDGLVITGGNANGLGTYSYGTINPVEVPNNQGGGIHAKQGNLSLEKIIIEGNEADPAFGQGGGIFSNTSITYNDLSISFNRAFEGGGIYTTQDIQSSNSAIDSEYNIIFRNNYAAYGGGSFMIVNGSGAMSGVNKALFESNKAMLYGGGHHFMSLGGNAEYPIKESIFRNNIAAMGGAFTSLSGRIQIKAIESPTIFENNIASVYGGGAIYMKMTYCPEGGATVEGYCGEQTSLSLETLYSFPVKFTGNEARSGNGGALYFEGMNYDMSGTLDISNNKASNGSGGGIYNDQSVGILYAESLIFDSNTALYSGGAIENINIREKREDNTIATMNIGGKVSISNNSVTYGLGGAIFNHGAYMTLDGEGTERILINNNSSTGEGGAIANYAGATIIAGWVNILNNSTKGYGGGISNSYIAAESLFKNVEISNNKAQNLLPTGVTDNNRGGAGMFNAMSSPKLVNMLIGTNQLDNNFAGGMYNLLESNPLLLNVTIAGNRAPQVNGSGLYNNNSYPIIYNTVIAENSGTRADFFYKDLTGTIEIQHSLVHGAGISGPKNTTDTNDNWTDATNPHFRNTATGNFRLDENEPEQMLINSGDNDFYDIHNTIAASADTDLDNKNRLDDGTIDIGAYESPSPVDVPVEIIVFLQGPMFKSTDGINMPNTIQTGSNGFYGVKSLPENNPYGIVRAAYADINNINGEAGSVTDWIRVDICDGADPLVILESKALLLKSNGKIVEIDGKTPTFRSQQDPVRLLITHRNHLAVLSSDENMYLIEDTVKYNFSESLSMAYKHYTGDEEPMVESKTASGIWCMWVGDLDNDGYVNNTDVNKQMTDYGKGIRGIYVITDVNFDGYVDNTDNVHVLTTYGKGPVSPIVRLKQDQGGH